MAKCINCNDIELKNPKAKYCSDKCRMAFKRKAIKLNEKVFGPQPEQRTRTERNPNKQSVTVVNEPSNVIPESFVEPEVMVEIDNDGNITPVSDKPKRGKDIKTFADLPPDVQETIGMMSRRDGKIDPIIKVNRTAIAINYQHLFPGRYQSTGVV